MEEERDRCLSLRKARNNCSDNESCIFAISYGIESLWIRCQVLKCWEMATVAKPATVEPELVDPATSASRDTQTSAFLRPLLITVSE